MNPPDLTVVVPLCNEVDNVVPLAREIRQALASTSLNYELVLVDDGSSDGTWEKIQEVQKLDPAVRGVRHDRNYGQSAGIWTGFQNSTAPWLATLDGDLQNDPADLPRMLDLLKEYDFVCGVRTKRKDTWVRRVSSKVARWARRSALGVDFKDTGCALRVFRREVLQGLFPFNGLHRFLPVLVHGGKFRTLEVPINHRPRVAGVSKYGVWNRLGRGIVDLFGVAWFQKRRLLPKLADSKVPPQAIARSKSS